jgi:two-component system response regulator AdeR
MNNEPPPRILVADDARDVADLYCFLLSSAGYRVQRAYDGLTALSLAKVVKPDAAVLNFAMPHLTGLEVLRELRAAGVRTKVVVTSGTDDFEKLYQSAIEAGAEACVRQPCPADRLLALVAQALKHRAPRDASL